MLGIGSSTGLGQGQTALSGLGAPSPQTAPQNNHVPIVAFNEEDLRKQAHSAFPALFGGVSAVQKLGQKYNLPSSQTAPQNNHVPILALNEEDLRKQAQSAFPAFFGGVSAVQKLGEKYGVPSQQTAPQNNHVPILALNEGGLHKQTQTAFPVNFGGVSAVQKLGQKYNLPNSQATPQNETTWDHIKDWGNVTGQNLEGISKDFWDVGKDVTSQNIGDMVHLGQSLYYDPKGTARTIYHTARDNVTSFLSHPAQSIGEAADWLGDKGHDLKNDLEVIPHIFNGHPLTQEDHDHYKKWNSFVLNLGENLLAAKGLGAASRGIAGLAGTAAGGLASSSGKVFGHYGKIISQHMGMDPLSQEIKKHFALQEKYKDLLDREALNYPFLRPYGETSWNMGTGGYDTRGERGLSYPIVLGEISHPQDKMIKVPIIFHEGEQDTSLYNGWGYGRRHIEFRHGQEIRHKGFKDALDFVSHIIREHDFDEYDHKHDSRNLAIEPENPSRKTSTNMTALALRPNGDHYSVKTAHRTKWKELKKLRDNREAAEGSPESLKELHPLIHPHGQDGKFVHPVVTNDRVSPKPRENSPLPSAEQSIKEGRMQAIPLYAPSHPCWSRNTSQSQQEDQSSCEHPTFSFTCGHY